jgi:hypothetical protein
LIFGLVIETGIWGDALVLVLVASLLFWLAFRAILLA